jgi:hypothetical protein
LLDVIQVAARHVWFTLRRKLRAPLVMLHPPFWNAGALNMALKAILIVEVGISKSTLLILLTWRYAKLWSAQLCVSMLRSKRVNEGAAMVLLRRWEAREPCD